MEKALLEFRASERTRAFSTQGDASDSYSLSGQRDYTRCAVGAPVEAFIISGSSASGVKPVWREGSIVQPPEEQKPSIWAELGTDLRRRIRKQLRFMTPPPSGNSGYDVGIVVGNLVRNSVDRIVAGSLAEDEFDDFSYALREAQFQVNTLVHGFASGAVEPRFARLEALAETALGHLNARESENLNTWADQLARDLSDAAD